MELSFETIGWYLSYDEKGRYPVDPTKPISPNEKGEVILYLTHRPVQQPDGTWVEWFLPNGAGEAYSCRYGFSANLVQFTKYVLRTGDKRKLTYSVNFSDIEIEEFFIGFDIARDDLFNKWPTSLKTIPDFTDTSNALYLKLEDVKGKLGGKVTAGDFYISFEKLPDYVDGVNYKMCRINSDNNGVIVDIPYKKEYTYALLARLIETPEDKDVIIYKDLFTEIFWNSEDEGVYLKLTPLVGDSKIYKISSKPVFRGDNIYLVVKKTPDSLSVNCNGEINTYDFHVIDYPEEYVEQDKDISISTWEDLDSSNLYNRTGSTWWWYCGYDYSYKKFEPNDVNRGNFVNEEVIALLFGKDFADKVFDFSTQRIRPNQEFFSSILYKPIKITITGATKPFYIGVMLNPVRFATVVKRVWKVDKDGKLVYEDIVYVV